MVHYQINGFPRIQKWMVTYSCRKDDSRSALLGWVEPSAQCDAAEGLELNSFAGRHCLFFFKRCGKCSSFGSCLCSRDYKLSLASLSLCETPQPIRSPTSRFGSSLTPSPNVRLQIRRSPDQDRRSTELCKTIPQGLDLLCVNVSLTSSGFLACYLISPCTLVSEKIID